MMPHCMVHVALTLCAMPLAQAVHKLPNLPISYKKLDANQLTEVLGEVLDIDQTELKQQFQAELQAQEERFQQQLKERDERAAQKMAAADEAHRKELEEMERNRKEGELKVKAEMKRIEEAMEKEKAQAQAEREESEEKYKKQLQDLEKKNCEEREQMRKDVEEQKKKMERDLEEKMAEHRRQLDALSMRGQNLDHIHRQMMLAEDYNGFDESFGGSTGRRGHRNHGCCSGTSGTHDQYNGQRIHTGPRGGRYVFSASGNKRYLPKT